MTDPAQQTRAMFFVMAAVDAAKDEGFTHVDISALWGGTLCPYMGWDSYTKAVETLWEVGAFTVKGNKIVIRRGK